jgi:type IV pilus assembly protein PilQ
MRLTLKLFSLAASLVSGFTFTEAADLQGTAPRAIGPWPLTTAAVEAPLATKPDSIVIEYSGADIQNVLRTLASKAGVNMMLGDDVIGKVTVHLENISYVDAMKLIAESKGYAFVQEKNVIKIKSRESLEVEPVEIHTYTLNYAKADDIRHTIESALTKQGKVEVDLRSNTLVIRDTPSSLAKLVPLIQALDTQTPQVMIEAKFVETTRNPKKDLGINWTDTLLNHQLQARRQDPTTPAKDPSNPGPFELSKNLAGGPWIPSTMILDAGEASVLFSFINRDTDTELLANPRIVTTDNGKAHLSIATRYPIPNFTFSEQTGSLQINGYEFKDIGIILDVLPRINKDDFITLEVTPEASAQNGFVPLNSGNGNSVQIPIIDTRTATTKVIIKSGNTLAIGGLMRQDASDSHTKVPLFGDIPGVGAFFRSKSLNKTKRDLLIFLTPTIVRPDAQTGYEENYGGFEQPDTYSNDKWMPHDNAKPRSIFRRGGS